MSTITRTATTDATMMVRMTGVVSWLPAVMPADASSTIGGVGRGSGGGEEGGTGGERGKGGGGEGASRRSVVTMGAAMLSTVMPSAADAAVGLVASCSMEVAAACAASAESVVTVEVTLTLAAVTSSATVD